MVHEVEVNVPLVVDEFESQHGHVEVTVPFVFDHGGAPEGVEVTHVAGPVKVVGDEAGIVVEVVVVEIGGVGDLGDEGVVAVVGDVGAGESELEAIDVAPEVGGEVDVDGRGVVLEAAEGHGVLTETQAPILVGHVVEVEEVGVVEEGDGAGVGDDALLEIVTETAAEVAAKHEVEVFAMDAKVGGGVGGGDFAVGADLEFELVEEVAPIDLGVALEGRDGGNNGENCY